MKIENCKLKIAGLKKIGEQISNLRCLLALTGLLAIAVCLGLAPARANETALFSIERAKDRTGRGSFPHDQKEHIKIQCADCHPALTDKLENTDQPMARDFPHSVCVKCHNFAAEFFKAPFGQRSRFCGVCHESRRISKPDTALRPGMFPRPKISDFDNEFSHKAHRKILPADFRIVAVSNPPYGSQFKPGESPHCSDCHQQIKKARPGAKDIKTEASHTTCFVCHRGAPPEPRRVPAEAFPYEHDCKVCHDLRWSETGPRAHTLFGSIKDFRHIDHDRDIRPKKSSDFPLPTAPDHLCVECHKPAELVQKLSDIKLPEAGYCNRCHINNKPGLPGKLSDDILNKLRKD